MVKCRVENDERARFWLHNWGGDDTFANLYLRLFSVSLQQNKILCEVGSWENEFLINRYDVFFNSGTT